MAAAERLRQMNEEAISSCIGAAGLSVGEITALIFTGAISFENGIRLVKVRFEYSRVGSKSQRVWRWGKKNQSLKRKDKRKFFEDLALLVVLKGKI